MRMATLAVRTGATTMGAEKAMPVQATEMVTPLGPSTGTAEALHFDENRRAVWVLRWNWGTDRAMGRRTHGTSRARKRLRASERVRTKLWPWAGKLRRCRAVPCPQPPRPTSATISRTLANRKPAGINRRTFVLARRSHIRFSLIRPPGAVKPKRSLDRRGRSNQTLLLRHRVPVPSGFHGRGQGPRGR